MKKRGIRKDEVIETIREGKRKKAKFDRVESSKNLDYNSLWLGKFYNKKKVTVIFKEKEGNIIVITVYAFYFQEEEK